MMEFRLCVVFKEKRENMLKQTNLFIYFLLIVFKTKINLLL